MKKHYPVIIEQDQDEIFLVECPVIRGCRSYGHTIEEAMKNISEAIEACLDDSLAEPDTKFVGVRDLEVTMS